MTINVLEFGCRQQKVPCKEVACRQLLNVSINQQLTREVPDDFPSLAKLPQLAISSPCSLPNESANESKKVLQAAKMFLKIAEEEQKHEPFKLARRRSIRSKVTSVSVSPAPSVLKPEKENVPLIMKCNFNDNGQGLETTLKTQGVIEPPFCRDYR